MSPTQASIFHRCDTRDKAATKAAQKGVAITAADTIAHTQAKILLSVHGVQNPATDDYYGTVLKLCQLDKCEVKDVYGIEKGYKYERKIVEWIIDTLVRRTVNAETTDFENVGEVTNFGDGTPDPNQEW